MHDAILFRYSEFFTNAHAENVVEQNPCKCREMAAASYPQAKPTHLEQRLAEKQKGESGV